MKRKIIALLLACMCLILPLIGCADDSGKGNKGDTDTNVATDPNLTTKDWKGQTFVVLTGLDRAEGQAFNIVDLVANEDNLTDPIQKAVYERNKIIEALYNADIERVDEKDFESIANDTLANGEDYSAYMLKVKGALTLSLTDQLLDLNSEVNYINLDEEWWDSSVIDSLSVKGRTFFALGDINTVDDDATWCILFNKDLQKRYSSLPNFYDQVTAGNWTVENMKRWAKSAVVDSNSDSSKWWDVNDPYQYGIYMQDECATVLLQSSGISLFDERKNGMRTSKLNTVEMSDAITAINSLMLENSDSAKWALNLNNYEQTYGADDFWQKIARGGFMANKSLFFFCHCGSINLIRDMEKEFGILPIPKLSEEQEDYGNTIQYSNATCYVIPYNTPDADFSAFMLEAMGFYSSRTYSKDNCLKTAYYETTLKRKATRDDESWDMLDLVFQNRKFDIACAMDTEGINSMVVNAATNDVAWATLVASKGDAIANRLNEDLAELIK